MDCNGTRKLTLIRVFFCTLRPQNGIKRRQLKLDLVITHQGQCPHQVSLNLANPHFQGLTRFLSQGLLRRGCIHELSEILVNHK